MTPWLAFVGIGLALGGAWYSLQSGRVEGVMAQARGADWAVYNGSVSGDHFSRLEQITPKNAGQMKMAWEGGVQANPLVVGRTVYGYTPTLQVFAVDGANGKEVDSSGEYPELAAQGMKIRVGELRRADTTASEVLFIGATVYDNKLRAFEAKTGRLLWEGALPFAGTAAPATYMVDGKQYVVIATSGARNAKGVQGGRLMWRSRCRKGYCGARRGFPSGMTTRKATATAYAAMQMTSRNEDEE